MYTNIYLNILKPIHYKETINVLYMDLDLYNNYTIDTIKKNIKKQKIHEFMKNNKKRNKIISQFLTIDSHCEQIFINFSNCEFTKYEDPHTAYYTLQKHIHKEIIKDILYNKADLYEYILGVIYKYEYIKGTNGHKQFTPKLTISRESMPFQYYLNLSNYLNKNNTIKGNEIMVIDNILKLNKETNDYKILYYLLFNKKSILSILPNDIILHIISKLN